ncbi:SDR family oxidoreductase [Streptomyces sp. NPDC058045]|uniref:SDR family oxidoreductase n=1 Tax=Streptomyces sp. NPDC058045 TaxID=3346311 RepID=UPI0036E71BCC
MSEPQTQRFTGKTVVVTGAAQGIGRGIAARFAAEGARVVLADRDPSVHDSAQAIGGDTLAVPADVTDPTQVERLYTTAEREFGTVDVSIQNAGVITISQLADITETDWDRVLDVNTKGVFLCAQAAAAAMARRPQGARGGRILNAASGQARQGFIYTPAYAASKFGVMGLTQSLAKELAPSGITVNAYAPGIVGSDMWDYNDRKWGELLGDYNPGELMAEWVGKIPVGRAGTADDIANVLLFLASTEADYVTGQTINIDGGMFMS